MVEIGVKALYSIVLLAIAFFCAREVWVVWFDRTLQIGQFAATKDGVDAASMADSFRRLVVQQQNALFDLYRATVAKPGQFRVSSSDVLTIHLSDLVRLPGSALDSLKIEAAGVNVTSILTTLRRWIVAPNEITGSIDQIDKQIYVLADWTDAANAQGSRGVGPPLLVPPQTSLEDASFDLACRILFAQIPSSDTPLKDVDENDFCMFSRALAKFRSYVVARNAGADETETKAKLEAAGKLIDRLTAATTTLIYAYKLGGYIELELAATFSDPKPEAIKPHLDKAQRLLSDYLNRLAALDQKKSDPDVQEKLASLATRGGTLQASENLRQVDASTFLKVVPSALTERKSASTRDTQSVLRPGASISASDSKTANTLGCFVTGEDGKKYFITLGYVLGKVGTEIVSPALIDTAETPRRIGKIVAVDRAFAIVEVPAGLPVTNDRIKELAPEPANGAEVLGIGKTTAWKARITGKNSTITITTENGPLALAGLLTIIGNGLPGDSGGPVLDSQDRLIGLLAAGSAEYSVIAPVKEFFENHKLSLL
jgi:hypothetical protein